MKDIELRMISELMKNSRRSDRELAKTLGVSQPTATRIRSKLEKEGYIKEYTMIPDFARLGYQMMAVAFIGKQETMPEEERQKLRNAAIELEKKTPYASLVVVNGMGLKKGRMLINLYKDYSSYLEGMSTIKNLAHVDANEVESFLVNLNDNRNFRVLSLQQVARHIQAFGKTLREEQISERPLRILG